MIRLLAKPKSCEPSAAPLAPIDSSNLIGVRPSYLQSNQQVASLKTSSSANDTAKYTECPSLLESPL
jgi:hypothetical protein